MTKEINYAPDEQNKPSYREVLEEVFGQTFTEQEAQDALFTQTEFIRLLAQIEQEQIDQEQGEKYD